MWNTDVLSYPSHFSAMAHLSRQSSENVHQQLLAQKRRTNGLIWRCYKDISKWEFPSSCSDLVLKGIWQTLREFFNVTLKWVRAKQLAVPLNNCIYQISGIARPKRELTTKFSTIFPLPSRAICYIVINTGSHSYQLLAALRSFSYPKILEWEPIN